MTELDDTKRREDQGKRIAVIMVLVILVALAVFWFSRS